MRRPAELYPVPRRVRRSRVGAFVGTTILLLVAGAALLAATDLWGVQARAVGSLLDAVGVPNEVVVPTEIDPPAPGVGAGSRDGEVREAHAAFVLLDPPEASAPRAAEALAAMFAAAALIGALIGSPLPAAIKGLASAVALTAAGTIAYATLWSPRAPLDVATLIVDWRTSAVGPAMAVAFVFAVSLYPLPGNFVIKTAWLWLALVAVAGFSVVRLAMVAAAYDAFGHAAFLPAFYVAGVFVDAVPGIAVLALAHVATGTAPRPRVGRRTAS